MTNHPERSVPSHRHGAPPERIRSGDTIIGPDGQGGTYGYPVVDARRSCVLLRDFDGGVFTIGTRRINNNGDLWRHVPRPQTNRQRRWRERSGRRERQAA